MNENVDYPDNEYGIDLMASAIPVDSAVALTAAAAGLISDDEIPTSSPNIYETHSPESATASEASDISQAREVDKDGRKYLQYFDDCTSESSETRSDAMERMYGSCDHGLASPEIGTFSCSKSHALERLGSFDALFR